MPFTTFNDTAYAGVLSDIFSLQEDIITIRAMTKITCGLKSYDLASVMAEFF